MIVRFDNSALKARKTDASIGVQGDAATGIKGESEADALVESVKKHIDETGEVPPMVEANKHESAGTGEMMADIEEHPGEDEEAGPELNEEALREAREKARRRAGGS